MKKARDEKDLIQGCVKQDKACQQELYERHSAKMFGIVLRYTGDYHTAEDLLQEGFIKVFQKVHMFRFEGSFEGWLRRIFVNIAIEHHRRSIHMFPVGEVSQASNEVVNTDVVEKLAANEIMEMVQDLSSGYRTVFNLFAVEGYSHKQISEMLDITEGTSKSQLARARVILQRKLEERERKEKEIHA